MNRGQLNGLVDQLLAARQRRHCAVGEPDYEVHAVAVQRLERAVVAELRRLDICATPEQVVNDLTEQGALRELGL